MFEGHPEPGDLIAGKYVLERVLGCGGMGAVYAAVHHQTGKRLALKILLPRHLGNPQVVERFVREAKAVGRIQHRHVIDVFDQGRDGNTLFMVLPLLEGRPLDELLHDMDLTLEEALVILVRAMEGVAAANELGVLHRDLKPSNIFVCTGVTGRLDDPRVLDFGISKLDGESDLPLTHSGVAVGTPYYMSLEQLTGQRDLDARVDVYAMGVILYEALSGELPHVAENSPALALRLLQVPPIHLSVRRPDLPAGLAAVVMRALARDREQRYATMRALIAAVLPYVGDGSGLTVREPVGPRLRTPRDSAEQELAAALAGGSATTEAAESNALERPAARPAAGSLAPLERSRRRNRVRVVAMAVGLLVVMTVLLKIRFEQPIAAAPHPTKPPAGPDPRPTAASLAAPPHEQALRSTESPTVAPPGPVATEQPTAPTVRPRKQKRSTTVPPTVSPPAADPAPASESPIRAGALTADEF